MEIQEVIEQLKNLEGHCQSMNTKDADEIWKDDVEALRQAINMLEKQIPRPAEEWHEEYGDCLWWKFPIEEAPYCGSPLDVVWEENNYDNYYTHFTEIVEPFLIERCRL